MKYVLIHRTTSCIDAIATIDEKTYNEGGFLTKKQGNQHRKALVTYDYNIYQMIRESYRRSK